MTYLCPFDRLLNEFIVGCGIHLNMKLENKSNGKALSKNKNNKNFSRKILGHKKLNLKNIQETTVAQRNATKRRLKRDSKSHY